MTENEVAAVTGITDEQLETLTAGKWVDRAGSRPCWQRWVLVEDIYKNLDVDVDEVEGKLRVRQDVYPSFTGSGWAAYTHVERWSTWAASLEDALKWCDDRAINLESYPGVATKQEERFAEWATRS